MRPVLIPDAKNTNSYGGCPDPEIIMQRAKAELHKLGAAFTIPVHLDIVAALSLAGTLQLALTHPKMPSTAAQTAHQIIDGIRTSLRAAGYHAHADFIELGERERGNRNGRT